MAVHYYLSMDMNATSLPWIVMDENGAVDARFASREGAEIFISAIPALLYGMDAASSELKRIIKDRRARAAA